MGKIEDDRNASDMREVYSLQGVLDWYNNPSRKKRYKFGRSDYIAYIDASSSNRDITKLIEFLHKKSQEDDRAGWAFIRSVGAWVKGDPKGIIDFGKFIANIVTDFSKVQKLANENPEMTPLVEMHRRQFNIYVMDNKIWFCNLPEVLDDGSMDYR